MKGIHCLFATLVCALLVACGPTDRQQAESLYGQSYELVCANQWQTARLLLDSIHRAYPREVEVRRQAKALNDSITYLEAQKTQYYSDSLLQTLYPQADVLLKQFRYEKNDSYEDHGRYVHRLLATTSNTARCFLQAYVSDNRVTTVKSYYYGSYAVHQQSVSLTAEEETAVFTGTNHAFEAEGWHEMMTMEDSIALNMLNFIASHSASKIRVHGNGNKPNLSWTYYLQKNEIQALVETYRLGFLMNDIRLLELQSKRASALIMHYQSARSER